MTGDERELIRTTMNAIDSAHKRANKRLINAMADLGHKTAWGIVPDKNVDTAIEKIKKAIAILDKIPKIKEPVLKRLKEQEGKK